MRAARCDACLFWDNWDNSMAGGCRRYAPRPHVEMGEGHPSRNNDPEYPYHFIGWPQTSADDWCGEFQMRSTLKPKKPQ